MKALRVWRWSRSNQYSNGGSSQPTLRTASSVTSIYVRASELCHLWKYLGMTSGHWKIFATSSWFDIRLTDLPLYSLDVLEQLFVPSTENYAICQSQQSVSITIWLCPRIGFGNYESPFFSSRSGHSLYWNELVVCSILKWNVGQSRKFNEILTSHQQAVSCYA